MKKYTFTLIIFLLSIPFVFAQKSKGILKVRLTDNSPISVAIDRRNFNEENNVITVQNFPAGRHYLSVFRWSGRRQRNILIYEGEIRIRPGFLYSMVIDPRTGLARVNNRQLYEEYYDGLIYDWDRKEHYHENDYDNNHNNHDDYGNNDYDKDNYGRSNNTWDNISPSSFTNQEISNLHTQVADRLTDSDKLKLLQTVITNRTISTDVAKQIMNWLTFESTKLEFVKWAYDHTSDRKNYWQLSSEFTFDSSKTEFQEFLQSKKQ